MDEVRGDWWVVSGGRELERLGVTCCFGLGVGYIGVLNF